MTSCAVTGTPWRKLTVELVTVTVGWATTAIVAVAGARPSAPPLSTTSTM